jgi:hypothetical protein
MKPSGAICGLFGRVMLRSSSKKKSWQLLLHRFPTKNNLAKRDVINVVSEADCIWFKFEEGQIIEYHLW